MSASRSRVPDPAKVIRETFREAGYADGWTDAVLADFAHELAEKQRIYGHAEGMGDHADQLADLIDPEVER